MNWTELDSSEMVLQMRTIDFEQSTKLTQCEERSDSSNKWCETPPPPLLLCKTRNDQTPKCKA